MPFDRGPPPGDCPPTPHHPHSGLHGLGQICLLLQHTSIGLTGQTIEAFGLPVANLRHTNGRSRRQLISQHTHGTSSQHPMGIGAQHHTMNLGAKHVHMLTSRSKSHSSMRSHVGTHSLIKVVTKSATVPRQTTLQTTVRVAQSSRTTSEISSLTSVHVLSQVQSTTQHHNNRLVRHRTSTITRYTHHHGTNL